MGGGGSAEGIGGGWIVESIGGGWIAESIGGGWIAESIGGGRISESIGGAELSVNTGGEDCFVSAREKSSGFVFCWKGVEFTERACPTTPSAPQTPPLPPLAAGLLLLFSSSTFTTAASSATMGISSTERCRARASNAACCKSRPDCFACSFLCTSASNSRRSLSFCKNSDS
jgi:hypothetical protein